MDEAPLPAWSAFRDLEASNEVDEWMRWLDGVAALEPVAAGKQRSFELLELRPGDKVLDVGCGSGIDVRALSALVGPRGDAVGLDSSPTAIEAARQAAQRGRVRAVFVTGDASDLPFPENAFDATKCDRTLQHVADPSAVLAELIRVTRPDGRVVISEVRNVLELEEYPPLLTKLATDYQRIDDQSWFGFMVPLLLHRAGLQNVSMDRVSGCLESAEAVLQYFDLPRVAGRAIEQGLADKRDYVDLVSTLERFASRGQLRLHLETFLFVGRVSPDGSPRQV